LAAGSHTHKARVGVVWAWNQKFLYPRKKDK
jgi:hypothetical protein